MSYATSWLVRESDEIESGELFIHRYHINELIPAVVHQLIIECLEA